MQSERKLFLATGAVFTVALGIFTVFFYLQAQAHAGHYPQAPRPPDPMMSVEMVKARIAKVHRLREAWQPWARQHQYILYKMLHAEPKDHAALMAVWEELPPRGLNGLEEIPRQLLREAPARYTWQPSSKLSQNARPYRDTPQARARLEISKKSLDASYRRALCPLARHRNRQVEQ